MIELDFSKLDGLVPAIAQDWRTGEVLMVAFMNRESWELTLPSGIMHYWSRSRGELWKKGLALLRRRPCTAEDIAAGLGLHINQVTKYLPALLAAGIVAQTRQNGRSFYFAKRIQS